MTSVVPEVQAATEVLRAEHISKRYGAVTALVDVNLRLAKGEVLGPDRRQRSGQVDADQDPLRLPARRTPGGW